MTTKKTLLLSIGCGVMAAILAALYLHIKEIEVAGGGELRPVLIAASDINAQTLMEPGIVRIKKVPRAFIQPDVLTDVNEIAGRVTVAKIRRGEQIVGTKLVMGGPESGLSFKLPDGKRAVSISVGDADSAGGLIRPDDNVDVVLTVDYGSSDRADKYTYTLFQNVPIIAVDNKTHSLKSPGGVAVVEKKSTEMFGSSLPGITRAGGGGKVFTFALDPEDAQKLIFANKTGDITLVLRSPMDRTVNADMEYVKVETITGKTGFTHKNYKEYRGR